MRVEIHSPDGLEAEFRGPLGHVEQSGDTWLITTEDASGIVFFNEDEMDTIRETVREAVR